MSHVFQIPDDLYEKLAAYAAKQEQTPETLFLAWVSEITRHLEASKTSDYERYEGRKSSGADCTREGAV